MSDDIDYSLYDSLLSIIVSTPVFFMLLGLIAYLVYYINRENKEVVRERIKIDRERKKDLEKIKGLTAKLNKIKANENLDDEIQKKTKKVNKLDENIRTLTDKYKNDAVYQARKQENQLYNEIAVLENTKSRLEHEIEVLRKENKLYGEIDTLEKTKLKLEHKIEELQENNNNLNKIWDDLTKSLVFKCNEIVQSTITLGINQIRQDLAMSGKIDNLGKIFQETSARMSEETQRIRQTVSALPPPPPPVIEHHVHTTNNNNDYSKHQHNYLQLNSSGPGLFNRRHITSSESEPTSYLTYN